MIIQKCIPLSSEDEWRDSLKGIRHSFAHTFENCYAMNLTTGFNTFLYSFEKDGTTIVCPFCERDFNGYVDIVTPYGFSGFTGNRDCNNFVLYWDEFVNQSKYVCGYISINPLFRNDTYFKPEDAFSHTNLYFIDLEHSLTELFDNLDTNRKKLIKNYRSYESRFIYDRKLLTDFFLTNYESFLKRINASKANYFSRETLEYICSLDCVFMVGAGNGKDVEAVYIFAGTEYCVDCLFNVATPEGRKFSPLLLWCGIRHFKKKKISVMNLGGGLNEDDNVALSKERFGGYKLPFVNLKQVYNQNIYNKLCRGKGVDPGSKSGFFPAFRRQLIIDS